MGTASRGNAAEAAVLAALVERDIDVFTPFGGGHPFDLVAHLHRDLFLRIQCKAAWPRGGCVIFNSASTDHGHGPRSYRGLADVFGVFFPPTGIVYLVPVEAVSPFEGRLRLEPARNNQQKGVRLAADFEIDRWGRERLERLVAPARLKLMRSPVELSPA